MGDVDNGGGCACVEAEGIWEISVASSQFYYKHKTALKNSLFKKSDIRGKTINSQNESVLLF